MRQLLDVGTQQKVRVDNLSDEFKYKLGEDLNRPEMLHIEVIYFTANGSYYYVAHEYKGNDKRYKGKKYARFKYENSDVKEPSGTTKRTRKSVPMEEYEIVDEKEAFYFVEEYSRLAKTGFNPNKISSMFENTNAVGLEEYINSLINKQLKK